MDRNKLLECAIIMARTAGDVLLKYFRTSHLEIETKTNEFDVVTIADKASEKVIKQFIHGNFPEHGIISEESADEKSDSEWCWIIDPLDGTTNYSQGLPNFSISIALRHWQDTIIGVVYAPYLGEIFHAVKGCGAFLNGKQINCSSKKYLDKAVLATGVPYDKMTNPDNNIREISIIALKVRGIRRLGSAALDLSYVAAGFFDGYWELNLNIWDVAAGVLLVEEAGGVTTPIRTDRKISILASNLNIRSTLYDLLLANN